MSEAAPIRIQHALGFVRRTTIQRVIDEIHGRSEPPDWYDQAERAAWHEKYAEAKRLAELFSDYMEARHYPFRDAEAIHGDISEEDAEGVTL